MRKEIICKYITIDDKEFGNEKDARVHEISLRYKRELANIDHKLLVDMNYIKFLQLMNWIRYFIIIDT